MKSLVDSWGRLGRASGNVSPSKQLGLSLLTSCEEYFITQIYSEILFNFLQQTT
jgi:hypothetical protein